MNTKNKINKVKVSIDTYPFLLTTSQIREKTVKVRPECIQDESGLLD